MFKILFDEHEYTCLADSPKGTQVVPVKSFHPRSHSFFSINALHPYQDREPIADYHHPDRPRRADANVVTFRNILVEMDRISLADQLAWVVEKNMPFTSCVYSGGKSYHFILSLADALPDRASYDALVKRLYAVLGDRIDTACKNPSRFSRAPGHIRKETFKFQDLRELRGRVPNAKLEAWLTAAGAPIPVESRPKPSQSSIPSDSRLFRSTEGFLKEGAPAGEWNKSLFKAACDSFSKGWPLGTFVAKAAQITGHLDPKDHATIMSAYQRAFRKTS
ncbi:MAG: hypothetical protein H7249_04505 [Chitinophagaceae bacterium]|nr:hypothetical protein [Oligoflexus sp.]